MLFSDLGSSVHYAPFGCVPKTFVFPQIGFVVECFLCQQNTPRSNQISVVKNLSPSLRFFRSFLGRNSCRALPRSSTSLDVWPAAKTCEQTSDDISWDDNAEMLRRRKIGLANKGRVPWNKGRKHSAETRERISKRTKEALRDPKVRKKMSECPRAHSNQTKARIRSSLRLLWGERLKWRRSGEKFLQSWAYSIAEAAKIGGSDQEELQWNSYEKIKSEIALQQLQWAEEKAKAKELARVQRQRAAQAKADRLARISQKEKELTEKAKVQGAIKRKTHKKSKEEKEELAVAKELKLKEKLTKWMHRKKTRNGQFTNQDLRAWERFDLDLTKRDRIQKEVSLADQIEAVKNKRTLTDTSSVYLSGERSVD